MKCLLLAAGTQTRWKKAGGKGIKQLTEIDGEPVIRRTFRLLTGRGHDVVTVVLDPADWDGLNPVRAESEPWMGEMGKFLHGRPYWPESGPIAIFYGDVFYTDQALDLILGHEPDQPTIYGRANAPGRRLEAFGIRFHTDEADEVERICRECARHGLNTRGGAFRWFHRRHTGRNEYRATDVQKLATPENGWVELAPDETDDFDRPNDLFRWKGAFR